MIPNNINELKNFINRNCYNKQSYSIDGEIIYEGFGLEKWGELYVWFYKERDQRENLNYFTTEKEAVRYAYNKIIKDKYANSHLIINTNEDYTKNYIISELYKRKVNYWVEEIPVNGKTYRIFVVGCDVNKVNDLIR